MNTTSTTTCPSCHGTGGKHEVISTRYNRLRVVKCLSCYGTGKVDADRVCPQCCNWIAACTCRPYSEPITLRAATKHKQHTLVVSFMEKSCYWVVRREGFREVARFDSDENAYHFAREAEWASETEWPELREKWGAKGKVKA